MRNARAHKLQWSDPTVHSSTVARTSIYEHAPPPPPINALDSPPGFATRRLLRNR